MNRHFPSLSWDINPSFVFGSFSSSSSLPSCSCLLLGAFFVICLFREAHILLSLKHPELTQKLHRRRLVSLRHDQCILNLQSFCKTHAQTQLRGMNFGNSSTTAESYRTHGREITILSSMPYSILIILSNLLASMGSMTHTATSEAGECARMLGIIPIILGLVQV